MSVGVISAFIAGVATFFAPCTLPLIPAFLAFLGGVGGHSSASGSEELPSKHLRLVVLGQAALFALGFSLIFILFGMVSGAFGALLRDHREILARIGGAVIILFGLTLLRVLPLGRFFAPVSRGIPKAIRPGTTYGSFLLGALFALGWSPCLGPILGSILIISATQGTVIQGGFLLAIYSAGVALPFLFLAFLYDAALVYVRAFMRIVPALSVIGALLLIVFGLLLLFEQVALVGEYMSRTISFITYENYL